MQDADTGARADARLHESRGAAARPARGRVMFYSRSRQRLWEKGETSGHTLELRGHSRSTATATPCCISARPLGPTCHHGTATCFGDERRTGAARLALPGAARADHRAAHRRNGPRAATRRGCSQRHAAHGAEGRRGRRRGGARRRREGDDALLGESADLLFHLLVLLRARCAGSFERGRVELLRSRHESTISTAGSRRL